MVKQGDIVKLDFDPKSGHEQAGYRPAVVISNDFFNMKTNLTIVCPITNTKRPFPLHVKLDSRTETTGTILCEQIKALDLSARTHRIVERLPDDLLNSHRNSIFSNRKVNTVFSFWSTKLYLNGRNLISKS
jgi:mRNA interferase MazF